MKEKAAVQQDETVLLSTLSGKGKTVMRKLIKKMPSKSFIYDATLRNLAEEHERGAEEDFR